MTARRRSHRRPLTEFAARSPLHALAVWLVRSALVALMFLAAYLLIANFLAPDFADRMVELIRAQ